MLRPGSANSTTSPPVPAVPAVRAASGDVLLARRKLRQPLPPAPASTTSHRLVDELHARQAPGLPCRVRQAAAARQARGAIRTAAAVVVSPRARSRTSGRVGPSCARTPRLRRMSQRACGPGRSRRSSPDGTRVPRWRDDDVAGLHRLSPKSFTPSRLECESRPFLLLPPAFLCAITAPPFHVPMNNSDELPIAEDDAVTDTGLGLIHRVLRLVRPLGPARLDRLDLEFSESLPVAMPAKVVLAPLELHHLDLLRPAVGP